MRVQEQVYNIIADKLAIDLNDITDSASFKADLGGDSIDLVELVMEFQNAFGITITDSDAAEMYTVGDAVRFIESQNR